MKTLAVDFGEARTGLAVCDPTGTLARPLPVIQKRSTAQTVQAILQAAKAEGAKRIVVGLPLNMDGTKGERALRCEQVADMLQAETDIPVELWDERRTTKSAADILSRTGTFGKKRKEILDSVAAAVLLESWLQRQKTE